MKSDRVTILVRRKEDIDLLMNTYLCSENDIAGLCDVAFVFLVNGWTDGATYSKMSASERSYAHQLSSRTYNHATPILNFKDLAEYMFQPNGN